MLFDAKKEIHSLSGLIAWLETQPPEQAYNFVDVYDCLLCRYFRARGIDVKMLCTSHYYVKNEIVEYPRELNEVANDGTTYTTYGDALARAKKMRGY